MTAPSTDSQDMLLGRAADWLVTLTSGSATAADARDLARWRAQDPAHDVAFRHVAKLMNLTQVLAEQPASTFDRRTLLAGGAGLAAVGIGLGIARPPLGLWPSYAEWMADHRTGAGERYAFAPMEGVAVEMNSRTAVSLANGRRALDLINGETFVRVRHTQVPFAVRASGLSVAARNAAFNLQAIDGDVSLVCVSGEVHCTVRAQRIVVSGGERVTLVEGENLSRAETDVHTATAWRSGLLVFEGTPLKEVVRQINRYRSGDIVVTDAALGRRPVNAVLHTDQVDNAVSQIQQLLNLNARHLPGGVILLS